MSEFRRGVRLGVDVGKARIGVARCDPDGMLAVPVETVARTDSALERLRDLAAEYSPIEWVVGLPFNLKGEETPSTADARAFAAALLEATQIPVRLVDERLTTVSAQAMLHSAGRNTKNSRAVIDQVAAVVLLQYTVDYERRGRIMGEALSQKENS